MKNKKRLALFLALVMLLGLVACKEKGGADSKTVVARVGDVELTQAQWDGYSALVCYGQGYDLSKVEETEETQPYLIYLKSSMLSSLVSATLLEMDYEAKETDVLGDAYDEDVKQFMSTVKEQIPDFLKANHIDDEDLRLYYKSQQYLAYAMNEVSVAEDEAMAYYKENPGYFTAYEDMVRASHILVEDEKTAKDIISQYESGADFAQLAAQYGTDGTKSSGGDLGAFVYGDMVEDFSKAAFALQVGEHTKEPVKSDFGYHVILVTDRVEKDSLQPYEWVKDTILSDLNAQAYYAKLDELMEQYEVEYFVEGMDGQDAKSNDGEKTDGDENNGKNDDESEKEENSKNEKAE